LPYPSPQDMHGSFRSPSCCAMLLVQGATSWGLLHFWDTKPAQKLKQSTTGFSSLRTGSTPRKSRTYQAIFSKGEQTIINFLARFPRRKTRTLILFLICNPFLFWPFVAKNKLCFRKLAPILKKTKPLCLNLL